jgi:hypothetical protein
LKFSLSKPDFAESLPSSNATYCTYQEEHYILNGQQNINMPSTHSKIPLLVKLSSPTQTSPFPSKSTLTPQNTNQISNKPTQKDKSLAFYSRKLTDPQMRFTITELKLLAIVETLCEYKCILLGYLIPIYTDHKNLTFSNFTTDHITHW